jgi:hypothetical protein
VIECCNTYWCVTLLALNLINYGNCCIKSKQSYRTQPWARIRIVETTWCVIFLQYSYKCMYVQKLMWGNQRRHCTLASGEGHSTRGETFHPLYAACPVSSTVEHSVHSFRIQQSTPCKKWVAYSLSNRATTVFREIPDFLHYVTNITRYSAISGYPQRFFDSAKNKSRENSGSEKDVTFLGAAVFLFVKGTS